MRLPTVSAAREFSSNIRQIFWIAFALPPCNSFLLSDNGGYLPIPFEGSPDHDRATLPSAEGKRSFGRRRLLGRSPAVHRRRTGHPHRGTGIAAGASGGRNGLVGPVFGRAACRPSGQKFRPI